MEGIEVAGVTVRAQPWRVASDELQNFAAGRRHLLPRFFVNADSAGVEVDRDEHL